MYKKRKSAKNPVSFVFSCMGDEDSNLFHRLKPLEIISVFPSKIHIERALNSFFGPYVKERSMRLLFNLSASHIAKPATLLPVGGFFVCSNIA